MILLVKGSDPLGLKGLKKTISLNLLLRKSDL